MTISVTKKNTQAVASYEDDSDGEEPDGGEELEQEFKEFLEFKKFKKLKSSGSSSREDDEDDSGEIPVIKNLQIEIASSRAGRRMEFGKPGIGSYRGVKIDNVIATDLGNESLAYKREGENISPEAHFSTWSKRMQAKRIDGEPE